MSIIEPRPSVTLCIPAHNEAATISPLVRQLRNEAAQPGSLVDEILVIDDRSTDSTAMLARQAGARVVSTDDYCESFGGSVGKGDAIWTSLLVCETDLIGWVDADLTQRDKHLVDKMFAPLVESDDVVLVKGTFTRVANGVRRSGGRVTTLTARPLISLLFPELMQFSDPLSGMFAGRTYELSSLWLDCDYGVDVGILLDVCRIHGIDAIREVNLGEISHRSRSLEDLAGCADMVTRAILVRSLLGGDAAVMGVPSSHIELVAAAIGTRRIPPRQLRFAQGRDRMA